MSVLSRGDDTPLRFPTQPMPIRTRVAHEAVEGRYSTAIARLFRPEDVAVCQLCPACTACRDTGLCLVIARRFVSDADAPLYAFNGGDSRQA